MILCIVLYNCIILNWFVQFKYYLALKLYYFDLSYIFINLINLVFRDLFLTVKLLFRDFSGINRDDVSKKQSGSGVCRLRGEREKMWQYRESRIRGTEDFPLSYYKFNTRNKMIEPHWHPEIEILYITEGEMTVNISDEKYLVCAGDILFVNPQELHSIRVCECLVTYYAAVFFPSLFQFKGNHFLEQEFTLPVINGRLRFPRVIRSDNPYYDSIHSTIHRMFCEDIRSKALVFADLTMLFCTLIERTLMQKTAGNTEYKHLDTVKLCIKYMEDNYARKITLTELADTAYISPNYFCRYFKKHTGISPFTQLNYIRVKEAAELLRGSDESVVSIAEACGYENVSFFIRKFKEIMGCTPSVYRRKSMK